MLKLFAFQSKTNKSRAIIVAETGQDALLYFLRDVALLHTSTEQRLATVTQFDLTAKEVDKL